MIEARVRHLTVISILICCNFTAQSQNDYIRLENDSVLTGYVKKVRDVSNYGEELEFWRTKTDKNPIRFQKSEVNRYAIGKHTYHLLKNFKPFPSADFFLHDLEAEVFQSGRIELLKASNPYYKNPYYPGRAAAFGGGFVTVGVMLFKHSIENVPIIFILHTPRNSSMRGVPSVDEAFWEVIREFFSPLAIESYEKEHGKLTFRKLDKLVEYYNMKTSKKL